MHNLLSLILFKRQGDGPYDLFCTYATGEGAVVIVTPKIGSWGKKVTKELMGGRMKNIYQVFCNKRDI